MNPSRRESRIRRLLPASTAVALALVFVRGLEAQVVTGQVLEVGSERPVVLAEVALVDSLGVAHDQTFTNQDGAFQLVAPEPGSFYVMVSSVGYELGFDGILDLGPGGQIPVAFYLKPAPVELEALTVTGSQIESRLQSEGFFERMDRGFGTFFTTEEVERSAAAALSDLLDRLPNVYNDRQVGAGAAALGPSRIYFRDRSPGFPCPANAGVATLECQSFGDPPGFCTPNLYVDGAKIQGLSQGADVDIYAQLFDVAGIEVYTRVTEAPIQFAAFSPCGVILIWTRRGVR